MITLRQSIPSVHRKETRVKAKLKRGEKKGMLHELQCNRVIPSLSILLPSPPALFSLEKGLSTTQSG